MPTAVNWTQSIPYRDALHHPRAHHGSARGIRRGGDLAHRVKLQRQRYFESHAHRCRRVAGALAQPCAAGTAINRFTLEAMSDPVARRRHATSCQPL